MFMLNFRVGKWPLLIEEDYQKNPILYTIRIQLYIEKVKSTEGKK